MSAPSGFILSPRARRDLREIVAYITDQSNAQVASAYVGRLEGALRALIEFPEAGRLLRNGHRRLGFERRMTVIYRARRADVLIVRVLYGGRDSPLNIVR